MVHFAIWALIASAFLVTLIAAYVTKVARNMMRAGFDEHARDARATALVFLSLGLALLCLAVLGMNITGMR